VIKRFRHKGLERFFLKGIKKGIQAHHERKLKRQLAQLQAARSPKDMAIPGWKLHSLSGELSGHWAVWVDQNWRLTFIFEDGDATLADYQDYH